VNLDGVAHREAGKIRALHFGKHPGNDWR
jgi:hypothetical protein